MNQWHILMQLMDERKEMIEKLLAISYDLIEQNRVLIKENLVLKQRFSMTGSETSTPVDLKVHETCEAGGVHSSRGRS